MVPLAWWVGSRDSPTTAVVTAVLFATSAAFVFYSSEARGYAPAVSLTLVAWVLPASLRRVTGIPMAAWVRN
jgi:uncharacterized membrane protein